MGRDVDTAVKSCPQWRSWPRIAVRWCWRHTTKRRAFIMLCVVTLLWAFSWEFKALGMHLLHHFMRYTAWSQRVPIPRVPMYDKARIDVGSGVRVETSWTEASVPLEPIEERLYTPLSDTNRNRAYLRIQIISNHLYVVDSDVSMFQATERLRALLAALLDLLDTCDEEDVKLPNVDFLLNFYDECRCEPGVPHFSMCRLRDCPSSFLFPEYFLTPGCDYPRTTEAIHDDMRHNDLIYPFELKMWKAFWRGSTTGNIQDSNWWLKMRPQLVLASRSHPDDIDAKFTKLVDVRGQTGVQSLFSRDVVWASSASDFMRCLFLVDVDGHGWSGRFPSLLRMNSAVLKATEYEVFFSNALRRVDVVRRMSELPREKKSGSGLASVCNETHFLGVHPMPHVIHIEPGTIQQTVPEVMGILKRLPMECVVGLIRSAQEFVLERLTYRNVLRHWHDLIKHYATRQAFAVKLHPRAREVHWDSVEFFG